MAQVNIQYTADISQLNAKLDQIIQKQNQVINGSKKTEKSISDASSKSANSLNKVSGSLNKVGSALVAAFSVQKIIEFTKAIFEAERSMELLQNRLNFFAGSSASGEQMFARLEAVSRRLGLNLNDTAEGMASFGIAAKQAGFSAQKSERIFVQVASGLRAAGASSLQTQRAFYALQQMMSKGIVAAEELRRQLGESLPGASDLMTKAYNRLHPAANLTNLEFTKLLESGKIISKEILPVFAQVIEETFAPALAGKQNSLDASLNKVNNEILKLKLNIGNSSWFKAGLDAISEGMFKLNAVMSSDSLSNLEKFNALLFANLASEKLQKFVGAYDSIKTAIDEFNNKVEQAIITNIVFGNALEKQSELYKSLSEEDREVTKRKTDSEIESNDKIIKSSQQKLKEYNKLIKATKDDFQEQIKVATFGKTKIESYGIEQKMLKDLRNQIKNITDSRSEDEKIAITSLRNAESRNEFLKELLVSFYNLDEELNNQQKKRKEEADKAEKQRLQDEVYAARARVELAMKGSQEESAARAELAEKQMNLDVFVAKSEAQAQLARVVGEKESNKQIEDSRRKLADALSEINEQGVDIDPNLIKRLNKEISTLKDIFSDIVIEDEIIPSEDIALNAIDKQLKTWAANKSEITMAIAAPYLDATELEIAETKIKYAELIKLTKENSEQRRLLEEALQKELENIRKNASDKGETEDQRRLRRLVREIRQAVNVIGDIYQEVLFQDLQRNDIALQSLENRLDKGLISEQQYEKQKEILLKRQFETEKSIQIARAVMSGANAILNIIGGPLAPLAPVLIPITAALTASQIAIIQSQVPAFKDGVIDLKGPGTETSDSIMARLSKGESVMTAAETRKHKDVLEAIRNDRLPSLIAEKYIIPAYKDSMDKPRKSTSEATSMELAFQTAELVQAVKSNKVINLSDKSVNRLASAMNKNAAMDKKIRRRGL